MNKDRDACAGFAEPQREREPEPERQRQRAAAQQENHFIREYPTFRKMRGDKEKER